MEQIKILLKSLGFSDSDIEAVSKEENPANGEELAKAHLANYRNVLSNDPEFINPIKAAEKSKQLAMIEKSIKRVFDLSAEEVKDKQFDEIIDLAKEKVSKSGKTDASEIQKQLVEANNKLKEYEEVKIPGIEKQWQEKYKSDKIQDKVLLKMAEKDLIVKPDIIFPRLMQELGQDIQLDFNEKGEIVTKTKDGLELTNADKTKILGFDDILTEKLTSYGVIKQSNTGGGSNGQQQQQSGSNTHAPQNTGRNLPPHLAAAQQHAQSLATEPK